MLVRVVEVTMVRYWNWDYLNVLRLGIQFSKLVQNPDWGLKGFCTFAPLSLSLRASPRLASPRRRVCGSGGGGVGFPPNCSYAWIMGNFHCLGIGSRFINHSRCHSSIVKKTFIIY